MYRSPAAACLFALSPLALGQAYSGITVRDNPEGLVVAWVRPGPCNGTGEKSDSVWRHDLIVSVNGRSLDADGFRSLMDDSSPGQTIDIVVRRADEVDMNRAVPTGDPKGRELRFSITLADPDEWTGTIGRGLAGREIPPAEPGAFEEEILALAAETGVLEADGSLTDLMTSLQRVQQQNLDPNSLPAVVQSFQRPFSADAIEARIAALAKEAAGGSLDAIGSLVAHALDLVPPTAEQVNQRFAEEGTLNEYWMQLVQQRNAESPAAESLLRALRDSVTIAGPDFQSHLAVIHAGRPFADEELTMMLGPNLVGMGEFAGTLTEIYNSTEEIDVPQDLADVIKGRVHFVQETPAGLIVVGGKGINEYDMSQIAIVLDPAGDDAYRYAPHNSPVQFVIDLDGDDTHESLTDFAGPATAVYGISVLVDFKGDDTYRSAHQFSIAAGLFGIGILIDHLGNDRYLNTGADSGWSMGVGFYGSGVIVDSAGDDLYHAEQLSQGVGGPRGFGTIIDANGNDEYRADGPSFSSVYGTEGVHKGFSQGFGYGVRGYAAGGIGAIFDLKGADVYYCGEFGQGCAYYFAMGILHDFEGDDQYHGNRYGQAAAAHQAIGLLIDDAGNDAYHSMTAASQAGAWDQSIAMLIDRAGDDTYEADGLAQGAAAQQAIAVLIDLGGADRYTAKGRSIQGTSGSNEYHLATDNVFSFSALLDRGKGDDAYSSNRPNNATTPTGDKEGDRPSWRLFGLFSDN